MSDKVQNFFVGTAGASVKGRKRKLGEVVRMTDKEARECRNRGVPVDLAPEGYICPTKLKRKKSV